MWDETGKPSSRGIGSRPADGQVSGGAILNPPLVASSKHGDML